MKGNNQHLTFVNTNIASITADLNSLIEHVNELNVKNAREEKLVEGSSSGNGDNDNNQTPLSFDFWGLKGKSNVRNRVRKDVIPVFCT